MKSDFKEDCEMAVSRNISVWGNRPIFYHFPYAKREYQIIVTHSWGSAYCDFKCNKNNNEKRIKNALILAGACDIKIKTEHDRINITFSKRKDYDTVSKKQLEKVVENIGKIA